MSLFTKFASHHQNAPAPTLLTQWGLFIHVPFYQICKSPPKCTCPYATHPMGAIYPCPFLPNLQVTTKMHLPLRYSPNGGYLSMSLFTKFASHHQNAPALPLTFHPTRHEYGFVSFSWGMTVPWPPDDTSLSEAPG